MDYHTPPRSGENSKRQNVCYSTLTWGVSRRLRPRSSAEEYPRIRVILHFVTGRSIPVVRLLWEQIDRVRFPAPRQRTQNQPIRAGFVVSSTLCIPYSPSVFKSVFCSCFVSLSNAVVRAFKFPEERNVSRFFRVSSEKLSRI